MGFLTLLLLLLLSLLIFHSISPSPTPTATAQDVPSSLLDGICSSVGCGKGTCRSSEAGLFGFECDCDPGWTQLYSQDNSSFLPCVIPNCSFDYSCYNDSVAPAPLPSPTLNNLSIFDSCFWSYCGSGTCIKTSGFGHRCDCKEGFSNLLNLTTLPCFKNCAFGANCTSLGITLSNDSSPSPPPKNSEISIGASSAPRVCQWLNFSPIYIFIAIALAAG